MRISYMITKYWLVLLMLGSAVPAVCMEERPNQSPTFLMCPELDACATVKNILSCAMYASYKKEALPAEGGKGPDDTMESQPAIISNIDTFDASRGLNATPLIHLKVLQQYIGTAQTILNDHILYNTRKSKEAGWFTTLNRIKYPILLTTPLACLTAGLICWAAYEDPKPKSFTFKVFIAGYTLLTIAFGFSPFLLAKTNSPTRLRDEYNKLVDNYKKMQAGIITGGDKDNKTLLEQVVEQKEEATQNRNFSVFLKPTDWPLPTVPDWL